MTVASHKIRLFITALVVTVSLSFGNAQQDTTSIPASPETVAFMAVSSASNPAATLAAAEDFVAKFPTSVKRPGVAEMVATQISTVRNSAVAVTLVDRARAIFTLPDEWAFIKPVAVEVFADVGRADEAFPLAAEILTSKPDELWVLIKMAFLGAQEAKKRNQKYVELAVRYGTRAIEIIEADQKPTDIDAESWAEQKSSLPNLYQQTGILSLAQGRTEEAKTLFNKATKLGPKDPANFALLGRVLNAEYEKSMVAYEAMPEGKTKQDEKAKLELLLDDIIDKYARAAGLATGKPEHQTLLQQVIPDLTNYYKYRHNQSTTGLRQLINKYRQEQ